MSSTKANNNLRLRIFAGPNGSGKSTIINAVKNHEEKGIPVDFGIYVNADDIALALRKDKFTFEKYKVKVDANEFEDVAIKTGLINKNFNAKTFAGTFTLTNNAIRLANPVYDEHLAQIIADFLRKKLLLEKKKFSFETVFSHPSKLEIIEKAVANGYKVYLYFVSTESAEINKYRVKVRTLEGGHDVDPLKIESRYYRALDLMYSASQLVYQAYFFDNSRDGSVLECLPILRRVPMDVKSGMP